MKYATRSTDPIFTYPLLIQFKHTSLHYIMTRFANCSENKGVNAARHPASLHALLSASDAVCSCMGKTNEIIVVFGPPVRLPTFINIKLSVFQYKLGALINLALSVLFY